MNKKKILILGANGMLGYAVAMVFKKDIRFDTFVHTRKDPDTLAVDISSKTADVLFEEIRKINPDYIINCVGVIKPMMAKDPVNSIFINAVFPHMLCKACPDSRVFHITTDCVFSGKGSGYTEGSVHDAEDAYGKSKSLGEPDEKNCMVLRTSIIGPEVGTQRSLIESVKKNAGGRMDGYLNHYWNGVTTYKLAHVMRNIIGNDAFVPNHMRHIFSSPVSKFELVNLINDKYSLGITIKPVHTTVEVDRTLNTVYPKYTKLSNAIDEVDPSSIHDQIDALTY